MAAIRRAISRNMAFLTFDPGGVIFAAGVCNAFELIDVVGSMVVLSVVLSVLVDGPCASVNCIVDVGFAEIGFVFCGCGGRPPVNAPPPPPPPPPPEGVNIVVVGIVLARIEVVWDVVTYVTLVDGEVVVVEVVATVLEPPLTLTLVYVLYVIPPSPVTLSCTRYEPGSLKMNLLPYSTTPVLGVIEYT